VISESERLKGSPERKYHFTINDIFQECVGEKYGGLDVVE